MSWSTAYAIMMGMTCRWSWMTPTHRCTGLLMIKPLKLGGCRGVLIDMGLIPIEDIPQLPKTAQDALSVAALVLKCLQEALDSSVSPWD
jgi:hypothetical protein